VFTPGLGSERRGQGAGSLESRISWKSGPFRTCPELVEGASLSAPSRLGPWPQSPVMHEVRFYSSSAAIRYSCDATSYSTRKTLGLQHTWQSST